MQPLGNKILVREITEEESKTEAGILLLKKEWQNFYRKVVVEATSPDSKTTLKKGDKCLCGHGGVDLGEGLWLCAENLLDCVI